MYLKHCLLAAVSTFLMSSAGRVAAEEMTYRPGAAFIDCAAVCPEMVVIPPGQFVMGSTSEERKSACCRCLI